MLYVQATQVDAADSRNLLLLSPIQGIVPSAKPGGRLRQSLSDGWTSATFLTADISKWLVEFGFDSHAGLSVMAVEMMAAGTTTIVDPLGSDLGQQRILRTSGLTAVPRKC
jgi:hypothetical protein